jgi:arylsulfatase A-like enzyme
MGFSKYISILTIFLLFLLGCQKKDASPKHIFFIVVDTLRADHLGCYGYDASTSPTIDQLAKEGVLFKNAHSTASSTLESVISFFNSTTALTNKVYKLNPQEAAPLSERSLQNTLRQSGYNTMAVVSNPWLKYHEDYFKGGFTHFKFVISDYWQQKGIYNTTDKVTEAVEQFLDTKFDQTGRNFFYIHYLDPHDPYRSPEDYNLIAEIPRGIRPVLLMGMVDAVSGNQQVLKKFKKDPTYFDIPKPFHVTKKALQYLISRYDAEIRHIDYNLDKLLVKLRDMNILEDSLIIVTADHGEEFLEHGLFKHGYQLYDESIHIPLIFYWKDHLKATRKENFVSGIDIAPTILNFCQINAPSSMLGSNMFSEDRKEPILFCTHFINQQQVGMRTDRWKLIQNLRTGEIKIFDMKNDPDEKNNLFDGDLESWAHLLTPFKTVLTKHVIQEHEAKKKELEIDSETKEQLRALGYL